MARWGAMAVSFEPSKAGGDPGAALIRELEEASLDGLPALHAEHHDGWLIRRSDGYSRRANSVWPLYPPHLDVDEKIAYCEALYAEAGLPCVFKLTRSSQPHRLDAILKARGYRREAETLVKVLDGVGGFPGSELVELLPEPDGEWIGAWRTLSDRAPKASVLQALLNAVPGKAVYAVVRHDGVAVACARAVMSGDWVGLFDLAVAPAYRRRGFARELMGARLSWGARLGARRAFLQVMEENGIARGFQEAIGFREAYRYWYRIQVVR